MTIFAIRWADDGSLIEATTSQPGDAWTKDNMFAVTEHPDMTEEERAPITQIKDWLLDNYNAGAHWIVECVEDAELVLLLRELGEEEMREELEGRWELKEGMAREVRAAGEW